MSSGTLQDVHAAGGGPTSPPGDAAGDGGGGPDILSDPTRFGLWLLLGTVSMLFLGFTSAYMVRRAATDWRPLPAIPLLWANTAALLASSVALEVSRRRLRGFDLRGAEAWLLATGGLGLAFFAGQVGAWQVLSARGYLLASSPHHSFFYVLTGVHLAHLVAAILWFGATYVRFRRMAYAPGEDGLGRLAIFWHFLGGLWVYLLLLLFVF